MKRLLTAGLLLLLLMAALPFQPSVRAQSAPVITVSGVYTLSIYGYATANETVSFYNNQSAPVSIPSIQIGLGNLSSLVVNTALVGGNFSMTSASSGGPYTVQANNELAGSSMTKFTVSALIAGEVAMASNESIKLISLLRPSLNLAVHSLKQTILTPPQTAYRYTPKGFTWNQNPSNESYVMTIPNAAPNSAETTDRFLSLSTSSVFFPLEFYSASRVITVGLNGAPMVTDTVSFKNVGNLVFSVLPVAPLTSGSATVTVVPPAEPRLVSPSAVALSGDTLSISNALGEGVPAGSNLTLSFQYPLSSAYYKVSGSQVTITFPSRPPVPFPIDTYRTSISAPTGITVVQGQTQTATEVSQRTTGTITVAYSLTVGWAIDRGVPAAALIFVLLFAGLFITRETVAQEEEETEEASSGERVEDMIKAFDDKTGVINGLWSEIAARDPNEFSKAYFDEIRSRLDSFRSRALQRLNEVKQKSTTQKFFDLLNQIHTTEREVDRAAKDKLNLYEQFYMRRMRRDVFDRLLPQYTKRLEKGLNDLDNELHVVQKEAKVL